MDSCGEKNGGENKRNRRNLIKNVRCFHLFLSLLVMIGYEHQIRLVYIYIYMLGKWVLCTKLVGADNNIYLDHKKNS